MDLVGKGRRVRTVPIPQWTKRALDRWITAAGITEGRIFRAVTKRGKVWGKGISQNVVWYVVRDCCKGVGLQHIAPHDLRRTCAKLCHSGGGELEQIQFLLGHASVQTTEPINLRAYERIFMHSRDYRQVCWLYEVPCAGFVVLLVLSG